MLKGHIQVFFVSMLPGLGKSTISDDSHKFGIYNMFDLEDMIEQRKDFYKKFLTFDNRGLSYKQIMTTDDKKQRINDIKVILDTIIKYTNHKYVDKLYIFSSIWWEHIGFCNTDIFVSMPAEFYNGKNLANRGREDLSVKFSDNILNDWANGFTNPSRNNTALKNSFVAIQLLPDEFLTLDKLRKAVNELYLDKNPVMQGTHTVSYHI